MLELSEPNLDSSFGNANPRQPASSLKGPLIIVLIRVIKINPPVSPGFPGASPPNIN